MSLKALIFDVDGTLAETEAAHLYAFNQVFAEHDLGWQWSTEQYLDLLKVTGGKERIRHYLNTQVPEFSHPDLDTFIADLHKQKTARYVERIQQGQVPLRQGVERLLNEAKEKGIRLAIATTTTRPNIYALVDSTLGAGSTDDYFEIIAAGDEVPAKKPAPDVYIKALDDLGLSAADCVAMEDSRNGLLSATAANLPIVLSQSPFSPMTDYGAAKLVVDHLGEPDAPMQVVQGDSYGYTHVNIALLQRLAEQN